MCNGIKMVWPGSEKQSQNQSKFDHKTAIFGHFSIFSKTVRTIQSKILQSFYDHYDHQNRMTGMLET